MQDIGNKVIALTFRLNTLEKKLNLSPLTFPSTFASNYQNQIINNVTKLSSRVTRLERVLGINRNDNFRENILLKNMTMRINALCQRIKIIEAQAN